MNARYGIDLSFRNYYDEEEDREEKTVNFQGYMMQLVGDAIMRFDGIPVLLKAEQNAAFAAPIVNEELLRQNGYKRGDILPAYLEAQLYEETEPMTDAEINAELYDIKEKLFDAIYHVKDALPPSFISSLGDDYKYYAARRIHNELGEVLVKQGKMSEDEIDRDLLRGLNPGTLMTPQTVAEEPSDVSREFGDDN